MKANVKSKYKKHKINPGIFLGEIVTSFPHPSLFDAAFSCKTIYKLVPRCIILGQGVKPPGQTIYKSHLIGTGSGMNSLYGDIE